MDAIYQCSCGFSMTTMAHFTNTPNGLMCHRCVEAAKVYRCAGCQRSIRGVNPGTPKGLLCPICTKDRLGNKVKADALREMVEKLRANTRTCDLRHDDRARYMEAARRTIIQEIETEATRLEEMATAYIV